MTSSEIIKELVDVIQEAIKNGDWKVDGACDPDSIINTAIKFLKES